MQQARGTRDACMVDIGGLNKVELLYRLWERQQIAPNFARRGAAPLDFDRAGAAEAVAGGTIDYYSGRSIKADLSLDAVDPSLYDRTAGQGAFQDVVLFMKGY